MIQNNITPMRLRASQRAGFTLLEVLAVVGIIVLLAGILLPALNVARKSAKVTAIKNQLRVIETAIVAYENDFKGLMPVMWEENGETSVRPGFGALGTFLVGPGGARPKGLEYPAGQGPKISTAPLFNTSKEYKSGDVVSTTQGEFIAIRDVPPGKAVTDKDHWQQFDFFTDGKDGPGVKFGARGWGPYIQPEKLKMRGSAILDIEDNPIGYVPGRAVKNNVRRPLQSGGSYVAITTNLRSGPQFDAFSNLPLFIHWQEDGERNSVVGDREKALDRMQLMMGAIPYQGSVDRGCLAPGKDPIDVPFLLWSGGLDGRFGPELDPGKDAQKQQRLVDKCDDVTNFR